MLAYIFWHWPSQVSPADYERDQLAFQRALTAAAPEGFLESAIFRAAAAPWLPASAGLRGLVSGRRLRRAWAAQRRGGGGGRSGGARSSRGPVPRPCAGALYRLRSGEPRIEGTPAAHWVTKPREMGYADFDAGLAELLAEPAVSLWRRQMVLGPAPEFCLLAPRELTLPPGLVGSVLQREQLRG